MFLAVVVLASASLAACGGSAPGESACDGGSRGADGGCAARVTCGAGTTQQGTTCVPAVTDAAPACGAGTTAVGGVCVPASDAAPISCGAGTTLVGDHCVAPTDAAPPTTCGAGTHPVDASCVPDPFDGPPPTTCGAGTHPVDAACVPDPSDGPPPATCGAGTHLVDAACVADPFDGPPPTTCGTGTRLDGGQCVPDPAGVATYIVRVATNPIGADGFTAIPVLVLGTNADGTPSTATVRLDVSRAGAGTITPSQVTLAPAGSIVYFVPCSASASASCAGSARITAAFPSAPNVIIAVSDPFDLVAPAGVGSAAPCLTGGNILFFDGDAGNFIFSGKQTVSLAAWTMSGTAGSVHAHVVPTSQTQGLWWDLYFDATKLPNPVLMPQVYNDAERYPFQSTGKPGFDVGGDGRGCNTETARFQIEDLVWNGSTIQSMTATFEQHCDSGTKALRGCMHFGN